jgi:amidase
VPAAHATDGGGSIRIPASHCGLVGLKTSRGRISLGPDVGERWGGFAVENSVTRSVRDTAAILDVLAGPMPGDPYTAPPPTGPFLAEVGAPPGRLRIGVMTRAPSGVAVHRECVTATERAGRLLESLGHRMEVSHPEALEDPQLSQAIATVITCSAARALTVWGNKTRRTIGPADVERGTWALAEMGRNYAVGEYLAAIESAHTQTRRIAQWWAGGFDLLLTPTAAEPPPPLGSFAATADNPFAGFMRAGAFSTFTAPFNVTGQPAISLPLHWSVLGLPVGTQLVAAYGREDLLIRVAAQLEAAQPWADRRPGVHA